jgi:sarcosine oxidase subunit gamma
MAEYARFIFQGDAAARAAAGRAFGVALPEDACRASVAGERAALWLGPDEQLLLAPAGSQARIAAELEIALSGIPHSLVDVSQRQVALAVAGPTARDLLASGCPLDLDPEAFPVGMCTRTLFGKAEALLWRPSAEEYHLEVGRSFADYVRAWLREAQ